jgi:hypothetical protein
MNTPNYSEKLNDIKVRMRDYTPTYPNKKTEKGSVFLSFSKLKTPYLMYFVPPVVIFIILLIVKPGFVTSEYKGKDNVVSLKYKFKNIFIVSIVFGLVLDVSIFAYFNK